MKLNHITLTSLDVPADRAMFEAYFDLRCSVMRGTALAVLHDDQDTVLVLNDSARKRGSFAYPEDSDVHHIGFIQDSREQVDALDARLRADGWALPGPRAYHGAPTFHFRARGGYGVEVATRTQLRRAVPTVAWHSIAARTQRHHPDDRFCRVAHRERSEGRDDPERPLGARPILVARTAIESRSITILRHTSDISPPREQRFPKLRGVATDVLLPAR